MGSQQSALSNAAVAVAVAGGAIAFLRPLIRPWLKRLKQRAIDAVVGRALDSFTQEKGGRFEMCEVPSAGGRKKMAGFLRAPRNLAALFGLARQHGSLEAMAQLDRTGTETIRRLTFDEALDESAALEAALVQKLGVQKGDHVSILMANIVEFPTTFIALTSLGAVGVTLNAFWSANQVQYGLEDSCSSVLIADLKRLERLAGNGLLAAQRQAGVKVVAVLGPGETTNLEVDAYYHDLVADFRGADYKRQSEADPQDTACIMYTSGTTSGLPKGVMLTHQSFCQSSWAYALYAELLVKLRGPQSIRRCDLITSPLFHAAAFSSVFLLTFIRGGKMVMLPRWDPAGALEASVREQITFWGLMPAMLSDLLNFQPFHERAKELVLTNVGTGGAACPSELLRRLQRLLPHITQGSGWGLTETNAMGTFIAGPEYLERFLSCGRPHRITKVKLIDPETLVDVQGPNAQGELCILSICNMVGYWGKSQETNEVLLPGGWVRSGDFGRIDPDGYVFITDRVKDVIIRGGENISAAAVEDAVLAAAPEGVAEVAVFGVADPRLGERLYAALRPLPGVTLSGEAIREKVAERLPRHMVPEMVFVRDEMLPRGPTGKLLKRDLREEYRDATGGAGESKTAANAA